MKVLLVDDARFMRMILKDILGKAGYEVVAEASTAEQAISAYKNIRPDLVTMDIVMPGMSGIEAVRKIVEFDPNAKILMVSAMGQQAMVAESLDAGASGFVVKPFASEEVLKKVKKVLNPSCVKS